MGLFPEADKLFEATLPLEINGVEAICIIGAIQLATRHPKFNGPSREIAEKFARDLQAAVVEKFPSAAMTLHMGWDQNFDIE
jgi:hypothetical protein